MRAGLIGHGIAGSLTPAMHEAEGAAQGLNYRYVRMDTALPRYRDRTLEDLINRSIKEHQGGEGWKWESAEMLAMTAYIGMQSRGMPVNVQTDGPMAEWVEKGKDLYYTRVGQLDMACSNCHEDNYGQSGNDVDASGGERKRQHECHNARCR